MKKIRTHLKNISKQKREKEGSAHQRIPGLVSICIPNYNKEKYLKECIQSAIAQTYPNIEIIVVDDCSDDNSNGAYTDAIARHRGRCEYLYHRMPRRVGTAWAQNTAYYLSKGEFIANMDSDDLSHPERIERQIKLLQKGEYDLVGSNYNIFRKDPKDPIVKDGGYWLKFDDEEIEDSYLFESTHCICYGSAFFKADIIEKIAGNTKEFIGTEDWDFVDRVAKHGYKIGNTRDILYHYRSSEDQRSKLFHGS